MAAIYTIILKTRIQVLPKAAPMALIAAAITLLVVFILREVLRVSWSFWHAWSKFALFGLINSIRFGISLNITEHPNIRFAYSLELMV